MKISRKMYPWMRKNGLNLGNHPHLDQEDTKSKKNKTLNSTMAPAPPQCSLFITANAHTAFLIVYMLIP